ncbi:MAG: DUF4397 domain-containing protein [Myxococcota bacterium]
MRNSIILALFAGLTVVGCDEDDKDSGAEEVVDDTDTDVDAEPASISVVHLSPDAPAVDIFAGAAGAADLPTDALFEGAVFGDGTEFASVDAASYDIFIAGSGSPASDAVSTVTALSLDSNINYTAVAYGYLSDVDGTGNDFAVAALADDLSAPEAGKFRVQVLHAAADPAFAQVDVWDVSGEPAPLIPDFDYASDAVVAELDAGDYTLCLDANDDQACDATFALGELPEGAIINLIAANDADGVPFLFAQFSDGANLKIDPVSE